MTAVMRKGRRSSGRAASLILIAGLGSGIAMTPAESAVTGTIRTSAPATTASTAAAKPVSVDGPAVTAKVTAPATRATLTFTLTRAETVQASYLSWTFPADGAVFASLTSSAGTMVGSPVPLNGSGPWPAAPQQLAAGSYTIVVDAGQSGDSGSVTVQLTSVGSIKSGGAAVQASIGSAEQPELYAFAATAGTAYTAAAAAGTFGISDGATLSIENAAGVPQGPVQFVGSSSATVYASATITQAGTYYVALQPAAAGATGAAALTLQTAAALSTATIGGPDSTISVTSPGLTGAASFTGTASETVAVQIKSATFTGYTTRIYVSTLAASRWALSSTSTVRAALPTDRLPCPRPASTTSWSTPAARAPRGA